MSPARLEELKALLLPGEVVELTFDKASTLVIKVNDTRLCKTTEDEVQNTRERHAISSALKFITLKLNSTYGSTSIDFPPASVLLEDVFALLDHLETFAIKESDPHRTQEVERVHLALCPPPSHCIFCGERLSESEISTNDCDKCGFATGPMDGGVGYHFDGRSKLPHYHRDGTRK
jgi:hypothetical protein